MQRHGSKKSCFVNDDHDHDHDISQFSSTFNRKRLDNNETAKLKQCYGYDTKCAVMCCWQVACSISETLPCASERTKRTRYELQLSDCTRQCWVPVSLMHKNERGSRGSSSRQRVRQVRVSTFRHDTVIKHWACTASIPVYFNVYVHTEIKTLVESTDPTRYNSTEVPVRRPERTINV